MHLYSLELESSSLLQMFILGFFQLVEMRVIDLDFQGHLAISQQNSKKLRPTSFLHTDLGDQGVLHVLNVCFLYLLCQTGIKPCNSKKIYVFGLTVETSWSDVQRFI